MFSAALRRIALAALAWAAVPGPKAALLPVFRFSRVDYVSAIDVAARLGLKLEWSNHGRNLALADHLHRIELTGASRDINVDGERVFLGDPTITRGGQFYLSKIDYERRLIPMLHPGWVAPVPPRPRIIALDPGHGGTDHGTENPRLHLMEKTFTLDVALRLRKLLEAQGYQVVMTRTTDSRSSNNPALDLPWRGEFANAKRADLFVSIHFNSAAPDTRTRGTEVFSFAPRTQRSTDSWDRREDDSQPNRQFPDAAPANRNDHWNVVLAHAMHLELLRTLHTEDRGEKIAHWGVLRPLNCPGILVESAFLSNDAEAMRVATPAFRQQIAEAMLAGIRAYSAVLDSLRPAAPVRIGPSTK